MPAKVGWRTANGSVFDGCGEFAKQIGGSGGARDVECRRGLE